MTMAIKLTVYAAERQITGACEKSSANYDSKGTNVGHEAEARCGLEVDLDPSVLADPAALHAAVTGYQEIVVSAMRSQLASMLATAPAPAQPVATATSPAQPATRGTWGNTALPAQATTKKPAPAPAPEAEDESQDEDDQGPPPKTGSQLFAWAAKHSTKGKALVYAAWAALEYKGKIMQANEDKLLATWKKAQKMLAERWDK
jgi:hypothetical protein